MAAVFFTLSVLSQLSEALENDLALTPPMGWSSWGRFRCNVDCDEYPNECISEWLFREMAHRMVTDGYLAAGYDYILIDDCWLATTRDENGRLQPDRRRFPSGIRNLSNYVHSLGLKIGIYEDYGLKTCEGYPGILPSTMKIDADTFASWGVDYIKIDACYSDPVDMMMGYANFGRCLWSTGRPMVYSCSWPSYQRDIGMSPNYTEAAAVCNLWRVCDDVQDSWRSVRGIMDFFGEHQEEFAGVAGPGRWNDPDMLVIGNFGLSFEQAKIQMCVWAILAAPLIMSHDLRVVHPEFRDILLNPLLISVSQDPMGIQGRRIYANRRKKYEVWTRPLLPVNQMMFSWAIAIINLDDEGAPRMIGFPLKYTRFGDLLDFYCFVDLFDPEQFIEISNGSRLMARVPPLGRKPVSGPTPHYYRMLMNELRS